MKFVLEILEDERTRSIETEVTETESLRQVLPRLAAAASIEPDELVEDAFLAVNGLDLDRAIGCGNGHHRLQHHRVCIDLHFETEHAKRHFPARARWARVHQWGCRHFHVAHDACPNLELREGAPDGPALNDNRELGTFRGCKTVWLVKPGPEPNGSR